jgi:hypothetical protein
VCGLFIFMKLKQKNGNRIFRIEKKEKMTFELLPILNTMIALYQKPLSSDRFQEYLKILSGFSKDDLVTPIGGFNPMAKGHVLDKLNELKNLNVEAIMQDVLMDFNQKKWLKNEKTIKVAFNLCDDLKGGWTNRYTTDFDSKFNFNALLKRQFCTPIFWSSEPYNVDLIQKRTLQYALRTVHWMQKPLPTTLREYVEQEQFVAHNCLPFSDIPQLKTLNDFYIKHSESNSYHLIFNFFYGNEASELLGFPTFEKI